MSAGVCDSDTRPQAKAHAERIKEGASSKGGREGKSNENFLSFISAVVPHLCLYLFYLPLVLSFSHFSLPP